MIASVVGAGWHDVCMRWDISTPQAVVARLDKLPGQGSMTQPGKKLFAERDRFGKWQHLLGPRHVLLAYVVESPQYGLIRRLELQAHLVEATDNDLCLPSEFEERWKTVQTYMAMHGALPPEDPFYVRVDPAVDVLYERAQVGRDVLEALRYARWPYGWYAEFQGPPPYTTVAIKHKTKTVARAYCRNRQAKERQPALGQAPVRARTALRVARAAAGGRARTRYDRGCLLGIGLRPWRGVWKGNENSTGGTDGEAHRAGSGG